MEIKTFGIIGAGQMGNGIAQIAAMSGLDVIMNDISEEFVERGLGTINKILSRSVEKGKMTDDEINAVLGRIKTSTSLQDMASADFVVEAAIEKEDIKFQNIAPVPCCANMSKPAGWAARQGGGSTNISRIIKKCPGEH
jgi:3-hydroxybutyryl-CoA dehydrogenase